MTKPHVIAIGYGAHIFTPYNVERQRLIACAAETAELHQIIFTVRMSGCQFEQAADNLYVYPTNSRSKFTMVFDAIVIARRIIKESNQNYIVTTQDPFAAGLVGLMLRYLHQVHLVVQEHGDVFGSSHWRRESVYNQCSYVLGRIVLRQAGVVRVVAKRVARHVAALGVPQEKIVRLPVSIDTSSFTPKHYNWQQSQPHVFQFVTVARLVKQKNFPLMLRAFKSAWEQNQHIRLRIIGSGPEHSTIKALLAKQYQGVTSPVTLEAWSEDIPTVLRQADSYLLTSNYEGWARVLIEAVVTNLPIVTTDVGCAGEVVLDTVHGLVVPVDNHLALAEAIQSMATDYSSYKQYVKNLQALNVQEIVGTDQADYGAQWVETLRV